MCAPIYFLQIARNGGYMVDIRDNSKVQKKNASVCTSMNTGVTSWASDICLATKQEACQKHYHEIDSWRNKGPRKSLNKYIKIPKLHEI